MKVIFILSKSCPKCELFKYGRLIRYDNGRRVEIYDKKQIAPGLSIIKDVCDAVGIPYTELEVGVEYELPSAVILTKGGLREVNMTINPYRIWLADVLNRTTIELPGMLIKSKLTKDRYVNLEIVTEPPRDIPDAMIISQWVAVRQCLRNIARTAVEEKLMVYKGLVDHGEREYLINRLWGRVIREDGNEMPDIWGWIEGFVKLRKLRVM